ncbi:MAG: phosphatidate cytidylyltransferase [Candidatus Omnitrophica bacterium]|nr:phosphatidate cytidylyltransferase [Candidatus Omnitrophota bacterium]
MLEKRILSTLILIAVVAIVVKYEWLCGLAVTLFIVTGLYEFFHMIERKGVSIYKYFGIGMGAVIPLSIMFRFELTKTWELLFLVLALLFIIIMQFRRRESSGVVLDISTTIFGILYVSWFLSFIIRVRQLENGMWLLVSLLLITKVGDIGAYLVGSRFGKTPLIPRISPHKSVEGSLGGLLFSVIAAVACAGILKLELFHLLLTGFCFGILGQLGDLSESLIKRDCQIKDSGKAFPGMGGVLDQIDSLLFTAPVFYLYMVVIAGS